MQCYRLLEKNHVLEREVKVVVKPILCIITRREWCHLSFARELIQSDKSLSKIIRQRIFFEREQRTLSRNWGKASNLASNFSPKIG